MKHQKIDRLVAIGLGAYLLQVDLSLHRAFGRPRHVLTDYLRDHSAVPGEVCVFFWSGVGLDAGDRLSSVPRLVWLRLMNRFRRDRIVSAWLFALANYICARSRTTSTTGRHA